MCMSLNHVTVSSLLLPMSAGRSVVVLVVVKCSGVGGTCCACGTTDRKTRWPPATCTTASPPTVMSTSQGKDGNFLSALLREIFQFCKYSRKS